MSHYMLLAVLLIAIGAWSIGCALVIAERKSRKAAAGRCTCGVYPKGDCDGWSNDRKAAPYGSCASRGMPWRAPGPRAGSNPPPTYPKPPAPPNPPRPPRSGFV